MTKFVLKVLPKISQIHHTFILPICPIGQNIWDMLEKIPYRASVVRGGELKPCCQKLLEQLEIFHTWFFSLMILLNVMLIFFIDLFVCIVGWIDFEANVSKFFNETLSKSPLWLFICSYILLCKYSDFSNKLSGAT